MQQGAGVYSLCSRCNNYFGANYVEVFTEALNETRGLFLNTLTGQIANTTVLQTDKMQALAFFKHIITSFSATTQFGTMLDCKEFLLNRLSNEFPSRYKLLMFAVPNIRSKGLRTGWMTAFFQSGGCYQIASLITPPFGFSLYSVRNSAINIPYVGCDITCLSECKWGEYPRVQLELPHAEGNTLFPRIITSPAQIS